MSLTLDSLAAVGAFSGRPAEKTITWRQGEEEHTGTVYVRAVSYQTALGDLTARKDGDPVAVRIASSICDADGKPIFTPGDITGEANPERGALDGNLVIALLAAVAEVQNAGKTKA